MDINFYSKKIREYGILPILKLQKEFEEDENFEECIKILDAIAILTKFFDEPFPTYFDKKAFEWFEKEILATKDYSENVRAEYLNNIDKYVKIIKKDIEKISI